MNTTANASSSGTSSESIRLPPPFIVGETYLDRNGEYTVISVTGNQLEFGRADGTRATGNAEIKGQIHRNILSERGKGHVLGGARVSFVGNKPVGFSQSEVFPIIASVIERHSMCSKEYMEHDNLVAALLERPELRPLLDRLAELDPEHRKISWWASNMVQWFSQAITVGRSDWDRRFERRLLNGCWAYRVRIS